MFLWSIRNAWLPVALYLFGSYAANNKLPYTENYSFDFQYQLAPLANRRFRASAGRRCLRCFSKGKQYFVAFNMAQ
jgi:hypothetical protein